MRSMGTRRPYRPSSAPLRSALRRRHQSAAFRHLTTTNRRRVWVVHLWEAFLLQMDDFDRLLEFQLRRKLDAIVAAPVPVRRGRSGSGRSVKRDGGQAQSKATGIIHVDFRPDALVFVEHS